MLKITSKQCRTARSLLKWNLYDLANHVRGINAKRIDSFEHGTVHVAEWENDEFVRAFKKGGIAFKADLEVALQKDQAEKAPLQSNFQGEGARIVLDGDNSVLSDSTVEKASAKDPRLGEEDKADEKERKV